MGRGRGKSKKLIVTNQDNAVSGEDEKVPVQKKRGRPQKSIKDHFDEEVEKIEDDSENVKNGVSHKEMKSPTATELARKRKRNSQVKEKLDSVEDENGVGRRPSTDESAKSNGFRQNGSSTDESAKSNGFRQNGSRRKCTPRRAAEAGVQCN